MCCSLCLLTVLFISLCIGSVVLCIFAGIGCEFFPMLAYVIETLVPFVYLCGEIAIYILSCVLEAVDAFVKLCTHFTPFISRGFRHVYNSFPHIVDDFNQAVVDIWNFLRYQSELFIFCWGLLLVPLYVFSNKLRNIFQGNELNNQNRNINESDDDTDYEEHADNVNVFNEGRRNRNNNGGQNVRNRQGNGNQRLYPELPDDSDNSDNNDEGYVYVGNQNDNLCVVCFEHGRNTAVFPCGHTQTCEQCMRNVMMRNSKCPVCQRHVEDFRTIYL